MAASVLQLGSGVRERARQCPGVAHVNEFLTQFGAEGDRARAEEPKRYARADEIHRRALVVPRLVDGASVFECLADLHEERGAAAYAQRWGTKLKRKWPSGCRPVAGTSR